MIHLKLINALLKPGLAFKNIAKSDYYSVGLLQKTVPFLLIFPPLFIWLGSNLFGWRLGAGEALFLDNTSLVIISFSYFAVICLGFFSTVF